MPLVINMADVGDIQRLLDIMYAAFNEDSWNQIMFPRIPGPDQRAASIARWRDEILVDPQISFLKVVDTDINEIISFARWHIYRSDRPESEWKGAPARQWDEGTNVAAANEFYYAVHGKREKVMGGKAHCCLNMLTTDPKHQRRGAGKMLLRWGTDIADESRVLPCYLEGSPTGHAMYRSAGFEDVESLDMNMSKWGGQGLHRHYVMIRPPKST